MRGIERRWKIVALLAVGIAIGVAMTATPAVGHVSGWVHNWNRHIKPRTDARYYTKLQAEARYYNVGETAADAANAHNLDGLDSSGFARVAQGAKGYFVYNDGTIEQAFNAINTGSYTAIDASGLDTIVMPFAVTDRIMFVSMGASHAVGGTVPGCFAQVHNVDATTIRVDVRFHDGSNCNEEWSLLIF